MKIKHAIVTLSATTFIGNAATTTWGGATTTVVDNWTTSDTAFDDTVQSGHSFNWGKRID